jgi:hypothetical protein
MAEETGLYIALKQEDVCEQTLTDCDILCSDIVTVQLPEKVIESEAMGWRMMLSKSMRKIAKMLRQGNFKFQRRRWN